MLLPFCGRMDAPARAGWIEALNAALAAHGVEVRALADLSPEARAVAEVAIVANPDPEELRALPALRWVQSLWAGVERMVAELSDLPITLVRLEDPQLAVTMAEAVLAWTLYLHRDMPRYARQQQGQHWLQHPLPLPGERTVSVLGFGNLGRAAGERLLANGFRVLGWRRSGGEHPEISIERGDDGLNHVLGQADIVVVLLPLTPETRGLLDEARLAHMKRGASLINFARGPIVLESALLDALSRGQLAHAVLDVFDAEPLPPAHPYWAHPDITVLPHISAPTNLGTASRLVAQNIAAFLAKGNIPPGVDLTRGY